MKRGGEGVGVFHDFANYTSHTGFYQDCLRALSWKCENGSSGIFPYGKRCKKLNRAVQIKKRGAS